MAKRGRKSIAKERRAQILDAFRACAVRSGLEKASLREVAEEAGLPVSNLHHFFKNRDEMVSELEKWIIGGVIEDLDAEFRDEEDPQRRFRKIIEFLFSPRAQKLEDGSLYYDLWSLAHRSKTLRRTLRDQIREERELFVEELLHARYLAYREQGLAGAVPYARGDGEDVSPGEELRQTEVAMIGLHELYPDFHNAWLSYPSSMPEDIVRDDYFWLKLDIEDRPTFVLSHRLEARNEDRHLVGVRDFYMSHFFDVSQRVAVVTRLDSGEDLLIYVERAWVDYWTGLASIKRKIGRKVLTRQMEHLLEDHGICGH